MIGREAPLLMSWSGVGRGKVFQIGWAIECAPQPETSGGGAGRRGHSASPPEPPEEINYVTPILSNNCKRLSRRIVGSPGRSPKRASGWMNMGLRKVASQPENSKSAHVLASYALSWPASPFGAEDRAGRQGFSSISRMMGRSALNYSQR